MLKLMAGDSMIAVLEPGNLARLKEGKPLYLPEYGLAITYTPDLEELTARVQLRMPLTPEVLDEILRECATLPEVQR